jgi:transposase
MAMNRVEVIKSVQRRHRWPRAEKERLVAAMVEPGANASAIARSAGIRVSQLYRWRDQLAGSGDGVSFVPVAVSPTGASEWERRRARATISIQFAMGVRVQIDGSPDPATLSNVIGSVAAAEWRR